jgi:O-methyltransferase
LDNFKNAGHSAAPVAIFENFDLRTLYLEQMIRSLTRFDYTDEFVVVRPVPGNYFRRMLIRVLTSFLRGKNIELVRRRKFDAGTRQLGRDWPINADTMVGVERLKNICECVRTVIEDGIPGDLVETGVWRGGAAIMMRAALEAYGDRSRRIWCADSFEGLPAPELDRYPQDEGMVWHLRPELAISLQQVQANFDKYGFLDDRITFLKGWFKDTLPEAPIGEISILRLDGDLYSSTMDALQSLYFKVAKGGFVIVDDYGIDEDTCRRAVNDFRAAHDISAPIIDIDGYGAYWRR